MSFPTRTKSFHGVGSGYWVDAPFGIRDAIPEAQLKRILNTNIVPYGMQVEKAGSIYVLSKTVEAVTYVGSAICASAITTTGGVKLVEVAAAAVTPVSAAGVDHFQFTPPTYPAAGCTANELYKGKLVINVGVGLQLSEAVTKPV